MKKIFILLFAVLFCITFFSQPAFVTDSLDKFIEREMQRWQVPGLAVAIIKDTQVVVMKGYGYADVEKKTKVNENTLFQIASNSKAFTGTALSMLHYQKKLSLDDHVQKWMPWFALKDEYAGKNATITDLLSHKIGFRTFQSDFLNWNCNLSRKAIIENMRTVDPVYTFREQFGYCNAAFLAAGEIVPLACDTSWDDFLRHRIFTPLQMNRTSTQWKNIEEDANACKAYTMYEGKLYQLERANIDNLGPAASVNSCVKDLSNWLMLQVNNGKFRGTQIIPERALTKTRVPVTIVNKNPDDMEYYGLGWFTKDYNGSKMIWHDGGADGFVTTTCFLPEEKIGIVVLTNTDASGLYGIVRDMIIDAYLNVPYRNMSEESFSAEEWINRKKEDELQKKRDLIAKKNKWQLEKKDLEGTYKNEVYGKITIRIEGGEPKIFFEHHPNITAKLEYMEKDKFLCTYSSPTWGIQPLVVDVKNNKVKSLTLRVNSFVDYMEYTFTKQ